MREIDLRLASGNDVASTARQGSIRRGAMRCSKCGADNREGPKFCAKCAAPLARLCPRCSASNERGEDFCRECATPLGKPTESLTKKSSTAPIQIADIRAPENFEGERKTITALFARHQGVDGLAGGPRSRGTTPICMPVAERARADRNYQ